MLKVEVQFWNVYIKHKFTQHGPPPVAVVEGALVVTVVSVTSVSAVEHM